MSVLARKALFSLGFQIQRTARRDAILRGLASYSAAESGSKEHIDELVKKDDIVVFMKGVPEQPMCGFSNVVIQILRMHGVEKFGSYNVLEDDSLRQGLLPPILLENLKI